MTQSPKSYTAIIIEHVYPELDSGRFPVKREVGERLEVTADIFKEGHDLIGAVLQYKTLSEKKWHEVPMVHVDNDQWSAACDLLQNTRYQYTIGAYIRTFDSWREELKKKHGVVEDLTSELLEGQALVQASAKRAKGKDKTQLDDWLANWLAERPEKLSRWQVLLEDFGSGSEAVDYATHAVLLTSLEEFATFRDRAAH